MQTDLQELFAKYYGSKEAEDIKFSLMSQENFTND